jgi:hypothetical protein
MRTYSHLVEVATRHSQVSTRPGYAVMARRTTDVDPYHTIGTASSKPHLEATGSEVTSPDVVGLGEGRPPAAGTDVPDNGLDPMVTMVSVRGGKVTPPVKAAISVNPAAGPSAPVWATTAVRDTAAACAPVRSTTGASAPVRAAATAPRGCAAAHCAACSRAASLASLSSLSLSSSTDTKLSVLLARKALSSATTARAASAAAAVSTSALAAASCAIASLAAVVVVSAAARSHSSAAVTSASCRCCALKATER